jgi:hypothetical protein
VLIALVVLISGCATKGSSDDDDLMSVLSGRAPHANLSAAQLAEVQSKPLGSQGNPVRSEMPPGERGYLSRLRCPDGAAPAYQRAGSTAELSPYGAIMDIYKVACGSSPPVTIFMDMYHPGYVERSAVSGFAIVGPDGA